MRELEKNKIDFWYVKPLSEEDEKDEDGNFTGEVIRSYGTPVKVRISTYPYSGEIQEKSFGRDASFDYVAVSNTLHLDKDGLLFYNEPTGDYETTYDLSIRALHISINTRKYGLKGRV